MRRCPIDDITTRELIERFDDSSAALGAAARRHLRYIAACDRARVWKDDDCRDIAQWVAVRTGISSWKAQRMVDSAYALERLPGISDALERGTLSLDKVLELTRFATPDDEAELIAWSARVAPAAIRDRVDAARRRSGEDVRANRWRELRWWFDDAGERMALSGSLPADKGAVVATALDRLAERMPELPDDLPVLTVDGPSTLDARRADALVALASGALASDHDPDRATVVVHAELSTLLGEGPAGVIAGGPAIAPEIAQRFACDCRIQAVLHDPDGGIVGIGMTSRQVPPWLRRQVLYRDGYRCTFPGCGAKRFVDAHHIVPWPLGPTDLGNLICVCRFHHDLVHIHGWHASLRKDETVHWYRPDWTPYEPRPAPAASQN